MQPYTLKKKGITGTRQLLHGSTRTNIITSCRLAIASRYSFMHVASTQQPAKQVPTRLWITARVGRTPKPNGSQSLAALLWTVRLCG